MEPALGTPQYYFPYVQSLLNQLDWKPDPELIVWHYTSGPGLISIIESGTIFATQVSCLNDATEIRYAASKLREALSSMLLGMEEDEPTTKFTNRYIELLQDDDAAPNSVGLPYFVSCFSLLEDDLSQWRSYGGGENGYAIGIKTKDLFGASNSLVVRVVYDIQKHAALANQIAEATVRFYKEGLEAGIESWDDVFLAAWDTALTQLAPIVKDPGFELEKEVRLIHQLQAIEIPDIRVLQRKTMMSRHLPMRFPIAAPIHRPRIPIHRVIVGPSRHKEISRISVDTLLRTHGYPTGLVISSARPYQEM
ncbi:DUF2971 domain-containing protein [Granulicella arctica]|uniref:DUF2971 domain-containing protein n=1 Tax=Granulicella arctica TaxID=940613 RepID=A0A7Y9TG54_9BACT|nr:DUF2971 domain-containing protein [Granulicella arctica]NYF78370.1 hypothetical protein [Granulicella arctica]